MRILQVTRAAQADLEGLYDYTLAQWGRPQADLYLDGLEKRVVQILSDQSLWRAMPEWHPEGFRTRYQRHVIFFVVETDRLVLGRVLHDRMDALRHLDGDLRG